ncbi:ACH92-like protein [Mya arenaria]|uniref:ACH92-like protein n=1 Tax=Mya arenaria TaxID=6604 RepID=A0ABY7EVL8_MYAAR|nr:acetylcholine receptor subunit alpha-1-B-like [Mya arenaria]WAR13983.1 ACH92-like protein [Mya arenaria]
MTTFLVYIILFNSYCVLVQTYGYNQSENKPKQDSENRTSFPFVRNTRHKRKVCKEFRAIETNFRTYFKSLMSNYSNYVPPFYLKEGAGTDSNFALNIRIQPELLVELEDVEERMTTVLSFLMEWKESNLAWAGMMTNVYSIILDAGMLWKPHIDIGNPHPGLRMMTDTMPVVDKKILLEFKGDVTWSFVWTVDTRCDIDVTYYPFDRQRCFIVLILSSDLERYIRFNHSVPSGALDNGNWKHVSTSIYNYTNFKTQKTHIILDYMFDRNSIKPILVFIAPVTVLISLLPLVFVLPNEGSERLSIAMTVLLAVSVYMTMVVDKLPESSDPLPFITTVFFTLYVYNAFVILLIIFNDKMYRKSNRKAVPFFLQGLVEITRRCFCLDLNANGNDDEIVSCTDVLEKHIEKCRENDRTQRRITWRNVSSALDKCFLITLYALEVSYAVVAIVVLSSGKTHTPGPYRALGDFQFETPQVITGDGKKFECIKWE